MEVPPGGIVRDVFESWIRHQEKPFCLLYYSSVICMHGQSEKEIQENSLLKLTESEKFFNCLTDKILRVLANYKLNDETGGLTLWKTTKTDNYNVKTINYQLIQLSISTETWLRSAITCRSFRFTVLSETTINTNYWAIRGVLSFSELLTLRTLETEVHVFTLLVDTWMFFNHHQISRHATHKASHNV